MHHSTHMRTNARVQPTPNSSYFKFAYVVGGAIVTDGAFREIEKTSRLPSGFKKAEGFLQQRPEARRGLTFGTYLDYMEMGTSPKEVCML